jgi:hypothetical protein
MAQQRISRDDLEAKLRALQGDVVNKVEDRKQTILTAASTAGVVLLIVFYLLGRRAGRKKTTLVEIRRV